MSTDKAQNGGWYEFPRKHRYSDSDTTINFEKITGSRRVSNVKEVVVVPRSKQRFLVQLSDVYLWVISFVARACKFMLNEDGFVIVLLENVRLVYPHLDVLEKSKQKTYLDFSNRSNWFAFYKKLDLISTQSVK